MNDDAAVRLDKWLWAARFFKTRSLATDAINGGKVHLNGERTKPSKAVHVGMELSIRVGDTEREVIVRALESKRGSASVAQQLYEETETSVQRRVAQAEQRKLHAILTPERHGRPTKKDRRAIIRFTRRPPDDI